MAATAEIEQWLLTLKIKPTDAAEYARQLHDIGVDSVELLDQLEAEDLVKIQVNLNKHLMNIKNH